MSAWLQLLRLPTVFTAMADILCGYQIAAAAEDAAPVPAVTVVWLLLSSSGLYLSGMVFNDVFDAAIDRVERPERPIPSGRISVRAAAAAGTGLMSVGLAAAVGAWLAAGRTGTTPVVAALLAVAVLAYDGWLKTTVAGPIGMAACRGLNLILGASAVETSGGLPGVLQEPLMGMALGLAVYVAGVTWFARSEAGAVSAGGLRGGLLLAAAGLVIGAVAAVRVQADGTIRTAAAVLYVLLILVTVVRGAAALRRPDPPVLQKTVGRMLLGIIVLDATGTFAVTGSVSHGAAVLALTVPVVFLKQRIAMS